MEGTTIDLDRVILSWPKHLSNRDEVQPVAGKRRSWIQLARTGKFKSNRYGAFSITKDDLAMMLNNFVNITPKTPTELPIDYDHLSMDPKKPGDGIAAGWMKALELRKDGDELWAEVEWTPDGKRRVEDGEYRFISPSFVKDHTHKDGRKIGTTLLAAAVTNHPFLEGMRAITLSNDSVFGSMAIDLGDRSKYPDGKYPNEGGASADKAEKKKGLWGRVKDALAKVDKAMGPSLYEKFEKDKANAPAKSTGLWNPQNHPNPLIRRGFKSLSSDEFTDEEMLELASALGVKDEPVVVSLSEVGQRVMIAPGNARTQDELGGTFEVCEAIGEGENTFVTLKDANGAMHKWFRATELLPATATPPGLVPPALVPAPGAVPGQPSPSVIPAKNGVPPQANGLPPQAGAGGGMPTPAGTADPQKPNPFAKDGEPGAEGDGEKKPAFGAKAADGAAPKKADGVAPAGQKPAFGAKPAAGDAQPKPQASAPGAPAAPAAPGAGAQMPALPPGIDPEIAAAVATEPALAAAAANDPALAAAAASGDDEAVKKALAMIASAMTNPKRTTNMSMTFNLRTETGEEIRVTEEQLAAAGIKVVPEGSTAVPTTDLSAMRETITSLSSRVEGLETQVQSEGKKGAAFELSSTLDRLVNGGFITRATRQALDAQFKDATDLSTFRALVKTFTKPIINLDANHGVGAETVEAGSAQERIISLAADLQKQNPALEYRDAIIKASAQLGDESQEYLDSNRAH